MAFPRQKYSPLFGTPTTSSHPHPSARNDQVPVLGFLKRFPVSHYHRLVRDIPVPIITANEKGQRTVTLPINTRMIYRQTARKLPSIEATYRPSDRRPRLTGT